MINDKGLKERYLFSATAFNHMTQGKTKTEEIKELLENKGL